MTLNKLLSLNIIDKDYELIVRCDTSNFINLLYRGNITEDALSLWGYSNITDFAWYNINGDKEVTITIE